MSEPMRYDLEDGQMKERPHCGEWVKWSPDEITDCDERTELWELIESMQAELEQVHQPDDFSRDIRELKRKYKR